MPISNYLRLISISIELTLWNLLIPLMSDSPVIRKGIQLFYDCKSSRELPLALSKAAAWSLAGLITGILMGLVIP
ncbi:MAG: hypothetical protein L0Z70_03675 [Chloroflexi bacterium]|nr:hypothetical protein [Chloroflexota bacterium]